jgi:hypothetical protein
MAEQTTAPAHDDSHGLSADHALNIAWWTWFALLSLPFIIFILTIWRLVYFEDHGHDEKLAQKWFIASMVGPTRATARLPGRNDHGLGKHRDRGIACIGGLSGYRHDAA